MLFGYLNWMLEKIVLFDQELAQISGYVSLHVRKIHLLSKDILASEYGSLENYLNMKKSSRIYMITSSLPTNQISYF